ncbi:MAG: FecR family protein [Bacteriovoracaceae bacterium]|nr:FecR family protein [Bacteriovoracaceae bacterium]
MNARRFETTLIAAALLMILVSAYQLFLRPIGVESGPRSWQAWLSSLENSAKHRRGNDLVWRDLYQGDRLSIGDSIFTGGDSRAQLNFKEGQVLSLSENTLVRLQNNQDLNQILLEQGVVSAQLGDGALELEMDGKKLELSGKGAQVQIIKDGEKTKLSVVEGVANVSEGESKLEVKKNEEISIENKKLNKRLLSYSLLSPGEGDTLWIQENDSVMFKWENLKAEQTQVEIAQDLKFKKIIATHTTTLDHESFKLTSGQYFWKVKSEFGESRIGTFTLKVESPIRLISPSADSVTLLPVEREENETNVVLEWESIDVKNYKIKIKIDEREDVYESSHFQKAVLVPINKEIFWSVSPDDESRPHALASRESKFKFEKMPLPTVPQWETQSPLSLSHGKVEESDLAWKGNSMQYEWIIQQEDKVIAKEMTSKSEMIFPLIGAGEYQVKVRGVDSNQRMSEWSERLTVNWQPFEARKPQEGQKIILEKPDQKIHFEWIGSGEQIFELSENDSFEKIILTQKGKGEADIVFPRVGTFFWRARKADGSFSEPKKVLVEPTPPLEAPEAPPEIKREIEIHFKKPKTSWIDLLIPSAYAEDFESSVNLSLPANDHAVGYKVEIFKDESLKEKIFSTTTSKVDFEWIGAKPGKYWWRYALIDAWGRESAMGPAAQLQLVAGSVRSPERAKLIRPIRAVELEDSPVTIFAWTESGRTQFYDFEVAKDEDFEDVLTQLQELKKNQQIVENKNWPRGEMLFWRVKSKHQWGETVSSTGRFQIGPTKILTAEEVKALPWRSEKAYSWMNFSLEPRKISAVLDDREYNGKIEGNALNSFSLNSRTLFSKKWALAARFFRQSGKVFEGQDYTRMDLGLSAQWFNRISENSFLFLGAGGESVRLSTYRLATPSTLKQESLSTFSPKFNLEWEYRLSEKSSLHTNASANFGKWSAFNMALNLRSFWRRNLYWEAGVGFEKAIVKAPRGDNTLTSMGLNLAAGVSF